MAPEFSQIRRQRFDPGLASMRPGPIGPGIGGSVEADVMVRTGFNEAGANWPRNSEAAQASARAPAAALMRPGPIGPGISQHNQATCRDTRASMRPGPIGPGILEVWRKVLVSHWRFNEAGANWPRNLASDAEQASKDWAASMRPGPIGPGIGPCAVDVLRCRLASMRPGPIGPGIGLLALHDIDPGRASMRPGPIGPGIPRPAHAAHATARLQ